MLRAISDEIPEVDAGTLRDERRTQADPQYLKRYIRDDTQMGVVTRLVFAVLRSPPFVDFLARLSGISGLLPDPVYAGSGVHITGVGGRLTVHIEWPLLGVEVSFALQSGAVCSPIQYYPVLKKAELSFAMLNIRILSARW